MSKTRNECIAQIVKCIAANRRFLVTTHVRPDGDALGSMLAMVSALRRMGRRADAYCQDPVPQSYSFLPGAQEVQTGLPPESSYDAAVFVDCGDHDRVGEQLTAHTREMPLLINIDHHVSNRPFAHVSWVEASASSTCEMLFDLFNHLPIVIDAPLACQLYTGLMTDTGSFRFSNTSHRVLEIASKLVDAGAEPATIAQRVFESAQPQTLHLLARMLATVSFHADGRLATGELSVDMFRETGTNPTESEGFINHLRSVKAVVMAMLFREDEKGIIHVSMRSKDSVDVAAFAQSNGGGGHRRAAAFRVRGELQSVRNEFTQRAVDYVRLFPSSLETDRQPLFTATGEPMQAHGRSVMKTRNAQS